MSRQIARAAVLSPSSLSSLASAAITKLHEMGEIKFKNLFVDGTKIEAYANRYTFVWKSVVEKNLTKLKKKISNALVVLAERYGFCEDISLEECYESLLRQAQWLNLVFAVGKGKHNCKEILRFYAWKEEHRNTIFPSCFCFKH